MTYTAEQITKLMDKEKVKYIRIYFTDVLGTLKGMSITRSEIDEVLENGQGFDGSSIEGFARIEESDLSARPDLSTFRIFPWEISGERVAMMFADVETPTGEPYPGDPRQVLRRVLKKAADMGYTAYIGPELEFFYFKQNGNPETIDSSGYFDYGTIDQGARVRKKTVVALESVGIQVECSHHEVAPSQHEIDLKYSDALKMADQAMVYRMIVKEVALENGIFASFMPKPLFGQNGSGMHCHQSLFKGGNNAFFSKSGEYHLSDTGRSYIAGLLKHVKEFTLITNQWVNSYKRLVPGYEAPVYVSWGQRNRSSLVRIPMYRYGKEKATRVELRSPDPACNPYLAFAAMIASGLEGIKNKYVLGAPIEENIFHMDDAERKKKKIDSLPGSLDAAIELFQGSKLMKETLGDHVHSSLIANKLKEWDQYRIQISQYEIDKFYPIL
ncbi:MAG: glutamine synthetase family protein [Candidatus Zixiibacteriota bacterium]